MGRASDRVGGDEQVKILIVEDDADKALKIENALRAFYEGDVAKVQRSETLANATKCLYERHYDLIVLNLMVPLRPGDDAVDISDEVLGILANSDKNKYSATIAISGFSNVVADHEDEFSKAGVFLIEYNAQDDGWIADLTACLKRYARRYHVEFLVICALDKERDAFRRIGAQKGDLRNISGLDCMEIVCGPYSGLAVKLPRMGLVEASVVTARAIEMFSPSLVAVSGICAGVSGNTSIGTLVVADPCWEYQAGKWAENDFKIEHYDIGVRATLRTTLSHHIASDPVPAKFRHDYTDSREVAAQKIVLAPMATGSAVIASTDRIVAIGEQHRKLAAIDMEMYGVYKAAELSKQNVVCFGAKTVVDLADEAKGDTFHQYGCILSAKFVSTAVEYILPTLGDA